MQETCPGVQYIYLSALFYQLNLSCECRNAGRETVYDRTSPQWDCHVKFYMQHLTNSQYLIPIFPWSTSSSLMPQKKSPLGLELVSRQGSWLSTGQSSSFFEPLSVQHQRSSCFINIYLWNFIDYACALTNYRMESENSCWKTRSKCYSTERSVCPALKRPSN